MHEFKQEQLIQEVKRIRETVRNKDEEIKQLKAQLQIYQNEDNQQTTALVQQLRVSTRTYMVLA